ncbi:methylated-DNA-[protein]-cysteine S-methyltransferase [Dysgonomonas sp. PH5-45]|uniref:methylated-DNA--[protein]-cysteine S-methyltransferase n=1 Tax=unclassified Dysgonomonas TaxID=2630389 RepID=UPI002473DAA5|nr:MULTISPECIES: methylated-DNA--[protein]-cysteine S-methyltransferase [unclassified Dysgonomonas]MDH6354242.1 methylated-DNA-[protein]-cysteine S-methyltransferase [Dysgonomonas sp. PH5-45]MDH6387143.1 methylated-DNA-[protein]-cysteine S-methyltransferase [Dysgonomonas sp. PH5-37]
MRKYFQTYQSPIGEMYLYEEDDFITKLVYRKTSGDGFQEKETPLLKETIKQLQEYFDGKRKTFKVPLNLKGTDFQKQVWNALLNIPYAETRSYKDIAEAIGNPKASRAIGLANNRNPISIIIPCHRVIGANGSLTGYAGGLSAKQTLLDIEKQYK